MKKIKENTTLILGLLILSVFVVFVAYLFYSKKVLEQQILGTDLIPGTPPFVIYTLDMLTLGLTFVFAFIFLKLLIFLNIKVRSERVLKEKLEERQELISIASHELSAPLTNIKGTLSVLSPQVSVEYRKFAERALISVEELIKLISDLLTVSRFEMGKIRVAPQPLQIEEIIKEVVGQFKMESLKRGAELVYKMDNGQGTIDKGQGSAGNSQFSIVNSSLPQVLGDAARIREVLVNLISNAIKYGIPQSSSSPVIPSVVDSGQALSAVTSAKDLGSRDSSGRVPQNDGEGNRHPEPFGAKDLNSRDASGTDTLSMTKDETPQIVVSAYQKGKEVIVSVADHGIGIAKGDIANLFNRFVRLHNTDGQRAGSGLGLYISRLIMEAHKGKIWVESIPGHGSTFYFSLPIAS